MRVSHVNRHPKHRADITCDHCAHRKFGKDIRNEATLRRYRNEAWEGVDAGEAGQELEYLPRPSQEG